VRLVDSHVHLDDRKFDADREAVIERALAAGVERMMAIGTGSGPPDLETAIRQAERYSFMFATIGVHPHDASKATPETFARLRELAAHPKVLAIGEIGLDYHYDFSPREVQRAVFQKQLEIAAEAGKPIVIHSREAWADTMALVGQAPWPAADPLVGLLEHTKSRTRGSGADGGVRPTCRSGIIHCFTGDARQAHEALDLGFHLAFGGVLTFPNADAVREAARITPEDRLLVETDCPYLAPIPHRGRRNEPAFVVEVARRLAEVRESTLDEIAGQTTRNFERLCLRVSPANG
jgi:TatD DNase family protein